MIYKVIDNDFYIIKIHNIDDNFDIYDHKNIELFIKKIFNNFLKKKNIFGKIFFNIFLDRLYGMIIEIKKVNELKIKNIIDVNIKFNLNISFLYEIDYFYLLDNKIINQNVYYYKDKFYLELINDIDKIKYIKLLDNSNIIYDNKINEIIDKGIKLVI